MSHGHLIIQCQPWFLPDHMITMSLDSGVWMSRCRTLPVSQAASFSIKYCQLTVSCHREAQSLRLASGHSHWPTGVTDLETVIDLLESLTLRLSLIYWSHWPWGCHWPTGVTDLEVVIDLLESLTLRLSLTYWSHWPWGCHCLQESVTLGLSLAYWGQWPWPTGITVMGWTITKIWLVWVFSAQQGPSTAPTTGSHLPCPYTLLMYGPLFHKKYTLTNRHLRNADEDSEFVTILLVFTSTERTVPLKVQISLRCLLRKWAIVGVSHWSVATEASWECKFCYFLACGKVTCRGLNWIKVLLLYLLWLVRY